MCRRSYQVFCVAQEEQALVVREGSGLGLCDGVFLEVCLHFMGPLGPAAGRIWRVPGAPGPAPGAAGKGSQLRFIY
ncbi:hypothetical protein GCM10018783_00040 [Streptomyces griseosporeus]|nr:hypothetical protein GCM10018783_00040 [Streptomyces griseosporeus]